MIEPGLVGAVHNSNNKVKQHSNRQKCSSGVFKIELVHFPCISSPKDSSGSTDASTSLTSLRQHRCLDVPTPYSPPEHHPVSLCGVFLLGARADQTPCAREFS